jgi:hypothetical protein
MKIITVSFQTEETLLGSMIYHMFYALKIFLKIFIFFNFKLVFFKYFQIIILMYKYKK